MKKMNYGGIICDVVVESNCRFYVKVPCSYCEDTITYAVEHFLARCSSLCRKCTYESWQLRLAKGKSPKSHPFTRLIPASLMELPGSWVKLTGKVDCYGVKIWKIELLKAFPECS